MRLYYSSLYSLENSISLLILMQPGGGGRAYPPSWYLADGSQKKCELLKPIAYKWKLYIVLDPSQMDCGVAQAQSQERNLLSFGWFSNKHWRLTNGRGNLCRGGYECITFFEIHNNVMWDWQYSMEYSWHSHTHIECEEYTRIFHEILSIPHNTVMWPLIWFVEFGMDETLFLNCPLVQ